MSKYTKRINYNISVYTKDNKLIRNFHSKAELEHWLKDELWGASNYFGVIESDTIETTIQVEDDLTDNDFDTIYDMAVIFLNNYWCSGCMGCLLFYHRIEECCDNKVDSFCNLIWKYNKLK